MYDTHICICFHIYMYYIYINIYIFIYCIYCKYIYLTNPSVHWQNPEWSSNYRWTKQYDLLPVILTKTCGEQHQSHCSVTVTVITGTNKTAHTMGNHQRSRLSFLSLSLFFFFFSRWSYKDLAVFLGEQSPRTATHPVWLDSSLNAAIISSVWTPHHRGRDSKCLQCFFYSAVDAIHHHNAETPWQDVGTEWTFNKEVRARFHTGAF